MLYKYFVSDMRKPFANIGSIWFENAEQIVDKYHWICQLFWAFEGVRKEEQKKFSKSYYRYFKNSRKLLLKRFDDRTFWKSLIVERDMPTALAIFVFASPCFSNISICARFSLAKCWISFVLLYTVPQS